MPRIEEVTPGTDFLKSLGFPTVDVHETFSHFDFTKPGRRVLVIGPMGSGKSEYAARLWRDAEVARRKSGSVKTLTSNGIMDRRNVFFVRSDLDSVRFPEYPSDALAYRGGFVRCGNNIARIHDSFDLEKVIAVHPEVGTYIIDEASFFDERIAYVVRNVSMETGAMFIFPTLILNFRRDIFNSTARLMLDIATDVIPLTAYCEHPDCMNDGFYTYRYYAMEGKECPALYFDPLIVVGGDVFKQGSSEPNYAARCDRHHYLPGKEYTFLSLKPMGLSAADGDLKPLERELAALQQDKRRSTLFSMLSRQYGDLEDGEVYLNAMSPGHIAEKALAYLFCEQNIIAEDLMRKIVTDLALDTSYLSKVLSDNRRPVSFEQMMLL
jgi:thymidine kinase